MSIHDTESVSNFSLSDIILTYEMDHVARYKHIVIIKTVFVGNYVQQVLLLCLTLIAMSDSYC